MSRNFEILTHVEEDRELFRVVTERTPKVESKAVPSQLGDTTREELVKLVQRIFSLSGNGISAKAVAFCGVDHGDGASWMSAQAGRAVAELGSNRICVVDANLRSPSIHKHLNTANRAGLSDAIRQTGSIKNFLEPTNLSTLWVLPAGVSTDPYLLVSDRFRERVAELRREFDFLIFDAPPAAHSNDAAVLGRLLDGVVLVVGANSTRRETARKAKDTLEKGQVHLLGTVLNGRKFPIPNALYRRL